MYWTVVKAVVKERQLSWYRVAKICDIDVSTLLHAKNRDVPMSWQNTCKLAMGLDIDLNALNEWKKDV